MDWTTPLRSQQTSFITRLTHVLLAETAPKAGVAGILETSLTPELTKASTVPVPLEQLQLGSAIASTLRAASRALILKSDPSLSVRDLFQLYLREQILQLTLSTAIGARVRIKQTADYLDFERSGIFSLELGHEGDSPSHHPREENGEVTSGLGSVNDDRNPRINSSAPSLCVRVLWVEGEHTLADLVWSNLKTHHKADLVVFLWIREPVTEVCNRYHVVLAGFLPGSTLPHDAASFTLKDLLYIGGLPCYIDSLVQTARSQVSPQSCWFQGLTTASNYVYPFAIGADGRTIASSSYDGSLRIWTTDNTELIASLSGSVRSIAPSSTFSGSHPLSSDTAEKNLKLSQSGSAVLAHHLVGHPSGISAVTLSPSSQLAVSGCDDGSISVWDLHTEKARYRLQAHRTSVKALIISEDETLLVSSATDRTLKVWDLPSGELRFDLPVTEDVTISLAIDPSGRFLVSGTQSGQVQVWNLADGSFRREISAHAGVVQALTLDPEGQYVASASTERTVKVWNLATGKLQETLTGHPTPLISLAPQSGSRWVDLSLFQHQQPGWMRSES